MPEKCLYTLIWCRRGWRSRRSIYIHPLNSSKSDTEKLNSLLHEYLLTNEDDGCNSGSDDEDIQFYDSGSDEEIDIDLRISDYDNVIIHAIAAPEIVLDDDLQIKKARDFR